ncbi:mechanosensitive ion channel family protein [Steroidobacter sp. S1-65]|uniref:Mechanosensitive ion channel family protein n=1 Tax=Steroidobacter gossypii TaxID=2805490 RepID=A0ABS1WSJ4_9GAMM|nr:mechanosensitive ion channel family protein [Steroidobacter gossypii]MBM0103913.1 mechanosensitive ion channel family protein [Steroidobacter gossypii]
MNEVEQLVDATYMGNTLWQLTVAGGIAVAAFLILLLVRRAVRARYEKLAATPEIELLELPLRIASRTTVLFLIIAALFIGAQWLKLPVAVSKALLTIFTIAVFWQIGLWATVAVVAALARKQRATLATDAAAASSIGIIGFLARATIWSFVLLLTLDNLGIQIKPLLAGLGIGGIAVALAAQNILGDLFASLSITLDRPFVVGDALQVDDFSGTVEYIGVKSTRLRSVNGEQIIMPNANLLSSRVRNHSRLVQRRVVINVSVDQQTPVAKLRMIAGKLRELIESHEPIRFDRAHFAKIGPSSFDFEAVYFVLTNNYGKHMDILQDINLRLVEWFDKERIVFSTPQRVYYVEQARSNPMSEGEPGPAPRSI